MAGRGERSGIVAQGDRSPCGWTIVAGGIAANGEKRGEKTADLPDDVSVLPSAGWENPEVAAGVLPLQRTGGMKMSRDRISFLNGRPEMVCNGIFMRTFFAGRDVEPDVRDALCFCRHAVSVS